MAAFTTAKEMAIRTTTRTCSFIHVSLKMSQKNHKRSKLGCNPKVFIPSAALLWIELANQDHSFMQAVEVMDKVLRGIPEETYIDAHFAWGATQ